MSSGSLAFRRGSEWMLAGFVRVAPVLLAAAMTAQVASHLWFQFLAPSQFLALLLPPMAVQLSPLALRVAKGQAVGGQHRRGCRETTECPR